jgi:hypothetical protein
MRIKFLIARTLLISLFFTSKLVNANMIITDTVTIGGKEWAQIDLFAGVSWNTLNTACPDGSCTTGSTVTTTTNTYNTEGWKWASNSEVRELFDTVTGLSIDLTSDTLQEINSGWAPLFFAAFRPLATSTGPAGLLRRTDILTNERTGVAPNESGGKIEIWDYENESDTDRVKFNSLRTINFQLFTTGALLFRVNQVPEPSTLAIFALGLMGLASRRFMKKS